MNRNSKSELKYNNITKKCYHKPKLICLADIRGHVLGGTPGIGESGSRWPRQHGNSTLPQDALLEPDSE